MFLKIVVPLYTKENNNNRITMPRKNSGMPFELHPSPMKNDDGENLLYVRPMQGRSIDIEGIDEHCNINSGLPHHTLSSVFNYFCSACAEFLADGKRIETPMGVFSPRLALKGEFTDPAQVHADDVEWRGVEFQPSKQFMAQIHKWSSGFLHAPNCQREKSKPTEAQLQEALDLSIADCKGFTTVHSFGFFSKLTRHSAQKYLDSLCEGEHPQLVRTLQGRTFIYTKKP